MTRTERHDILLTGYYGFGNAGDEAILEAAVDAFKKRGITAAVLSHAAPETSRTLDVPAYPRAGLGNLLRAMRHSKLILSGGGGLFQDITSFKSLLYYTRIPILAKFLGKKTMVFAQGIGPIKTFSGRRLVRLVINRFVDVITVRDSRSKDLLLELGVKKPIEVTADLAFLLRLPSPEEHTAIGERLGLSKIHPPRFGIALRQWPSIEGLLPEIARAISALSKKHALSPILIPFQPGTDLSVLEALGEKIDVPHRLVRDRLAPRELLALTGHLDLLMGMRFHALLFAARMSVPFLGIAYDEKVESLSRALGTPALDLKGLSTQAFVQMLDLVWKKRESLRKLLDAKVPPLTAASERNIELAAGLL